MNLWNTVLLALIFIPATCVAYTSLQLFIERDGFSIYSNPNNYACHDVATSLAKKVSVVIMATDDCVDFFYEKSCQGYSFRLIGSKDLTGTTHDNKIVSWQPCAPFKNFCPTPTITINTDNAIDLESFGREVKSVLEYWFHLTCRNHWSRSYKDVEAIEVIFVEKMNGIIGADVWGRKINALASYFRDNKNTESKRKFLHEMAHIVQQYRSGCSWFSEGMADNIPRDYYRPDGKKPEKPGSGESYLTDWVWLFKYFHYGKYNMLDSINDDCRRGKFRMERIKEVSGDTIEKLWEDAKRVWYLIP